MGETGRALTVTPEEFSLVEYDATRIASIADGLRHDVGLPADLEIQVDVDETTPMGRARIVSVDPVVLRFESGALEDPKRPRQLSEEGARDAIGRLLFRLRDALDPGFGLPQDLDEVPAAHQVAWDTYCMARLGRIGGHAARQRRLYQFRNRHGFTDVADHAFEELWNRDDLDYPRIAALSEAALAARPGAA